MCKRGSDKLERLEVLVLPHSPRGYHCGHRAGNQVQLQIAQRLLVPAPVLTPDFDTGWAQVAYKTVALVIVHLLGDWHFHLFSRTVPSIYHANHHPFMLHDTTCGYMVQEMVLFGE